MGNGGRNQVAKKKEMTLDEVRDKIEGLKKLPPPQDIKFYREVCKLSNLGINPHSLVCKKHPTKKMHISKECFIAMFGNGENRNGFPPSICKYLEVIEFMRKIWLPCYGFRSIPSGMLISKEFYLGLLAEHELGMDVD